MAHREEVVNKAGQIVEDSIHANLHRKLQDLLGGRGVDGGQEVAAEGVRVHLQALVVGTLNEAVPRGTCSSGVMHMRRGCCVVQRTAVAELHLAVAAECVLAQGQGLVRDTVLDVLRKHTPLTQFHA